MATFAGWFKVIREGQLLGVVTDQSFARYSTKSGRLHICKAIDGQYLVLKDHFYRDDWMLPLDPRARTDYENATIIAISENEYDILSEIDTTEPVNLESLINAEPEEISEKKLKETDQITVDFVRKHKLEELSADCQKAIEGGFSLVLSDGASHHFSMTQNDQLNLMNLQKALDENDDLLYHADGELMQYYCQEDATDILIGAKKWKSYHLTLFNCYKNWINHLDSIAEIDAIAYDSGDTEIPDEFVTDVFQALVDNF